MQPPLLLRIKQSIAAGVVPVSRARLYVRWADPSRILIAEAAIARQHVGAAGL